MPRGNQIARQWTIIQLLDGRRRGITIAELSRELNCTPRTVYRDLDVLQRAGFPITNELDSGQGYWQFVDGYRSSLPTPFSLDELMSLYLSRDVLKSLQGTFFFESLKNLIGKIRAQLGPELTQFLDESEQAFAGRPGPAVDYRKHRELLDLLNQACLKGEVVKFRYYSRKNEQTQRKVDPYKVCYHQGTLYLIGQDHGCEALRMFAVNRIQLLEKTGGKFQRPADFSVEEFLRHSFGVMREELTPVIVRVHPQIARFVAEKSWHPSQKVRKTANGGLDFHFEVAGTLEVKQWVLGMGSLAWVLEPPGLAEEIVGDLEKSLQNYSVGSQRPRQQAG